jgi:putative NIF3 family GTP cyclohydrolase 1 type 2
MKAINLYDKLEKDFIHDGLTDDWAEYMGAIKEYLCENFKKRSMGLVCDFADEINKVYTAVFPTDEVMQKIVDEGIVGAMLFVHHPSIWDISSKEVFYQMSPSLLDKFKEQKVSIYNLHVPLDNFCDYSTSKTLADALDITVEEPFAKYRGALCGVIGRTNCNTIQELQNKVSSVLNHDTSLYLYGENEIRNNRVAIVAGGGNQKSFVLEAIDYDVNVFITGISSKNVGYTLAHELEQNHKINVIGGTHYSTEKFACMAMCEYFEKVGLPVEFIEGVAVLDDI